MLASSSNDQTIRLWDSVRGDLWGTLTGHSQGAIPVVFSPDGQLLASGSRDGTIRLWDPITGHSRGTLERKDHSGFNKLPAEEIRIQNQHAYHGKSERSSDFYFLQYKNTPILKIKLGS